MSDPSPELARLRELRRERGLVLFAKRTPERGELLAEIGRDLAEALAAASNPALRPP
jgi:hypothetical protein